MEKSVLGKAGEDLAAIFLKRKGYGILDRNFRRKFGEIDIVARAPDGTLVFVEVKTLKNYGPEGLKPEDNLSSAKLRKFKRICEGYVASNEDHVNEKKGWRMDLICVEIPREDWNYEDLTKIEKDCVIRHYENI